jgi:hypothetical protein
MCDISSVRFGCQGLRTAEQIKRSADALVEANWLRSPSLCDEFGQRGRTAYPVNPRLRSAG